MNENNGFFLTETAIYAFEDQDVYPDLVSFAAAIPDHLKPLFLVPINVDFVDNDPAMRVAFSGNTDEADLFGTQTFVTYDESPSVQNSLPGSIFDAYDNESRTHTQDALDDVNEQAPSDTSFMSDVDMTDYQSYPYRTKEVVVKHSSRMPVLINFKVAVKSEYLESHTPSSIKKNSNRCSVAFVSYDKKTRVYTFSVNCGNGPHDVKAAISTIDDVSVSCNCEFWRYNGPEFHSKSNKFLLGNPYGKATAPSTRDADGQFWLCKHAYAVVKKMDNFVKKVVDNGWDDTEEEVLDRLDDNWDLLGGISEVPMSEEPK